jgi:hypothetical protein
MACRDWKKAVVGISLSSVAMGVYTPPIRPATENVAFVDQSIRRCWVQNGVRYCNRLRNGNTNGYRVRGIPEVYPTGSQHWWEEMDRQNRGGRGGRN